MAAKFGSCCEMLKEAMSDQEFDPLIGVGEDGVLYMSIGLVEDEQNEPSMVDYPLMFCPFCGSGVQTDAEIDAKGAARA